MPTAKPTKKTVKRPAAKKAATKKSAKRPADKKAAKRSAAKKTTIEPKKAAGSKALRWAKGHGPQTKAEAADWDKDRSARSPKLLMRLAVRYSPKLTLLSLRRTCGDRVYMDVFYKGYDPDFDASIHRAARLTSDSAGYDTRSHERDLNFPTTADAGLRAAARIKALKDSSDVRIEFSLRSW